MNRFSGRTCRMLTAMAILVMMVQVAEAQRGEGRRGRGDRGGAGGPGGRGVGVASVQLVSVDSVQDALNLTEEQKQKAAKINDQLREEGRKAIEDGRGDFRQMRGQMQKLLDAATVELAAVLDEQQKKRLAGIVIQVNDGGALADPLVAAKLNVTDEQKAKLTEVRESQMREMREQRRGRRQQDLSREEIREMRKKMDERRGEAHKQIMAVLTSEQQQQFESLKGEPVDIDVSQLRGRGGRPGFGGPDRRGERGRDRGRDKRGSDESESKDASRTN